MSKCLPHYPISYCCNNFDEPYFRAQPPLSQEIPVIDMVAPQDVIYLTDPTKTPNVSFRLYGRRIEVHPHYLLHNSRNTLRQLWLEYYHKLRFTTSPIFVSPSVAELHYFSARHPDKVATVLIPSHAYQTKDHSRFAEVVKFCNNNATHFTMIEIESFEQYLLDNQETETARTFFLCEIFTVSGYIERVVPLLNQIDVMYMIHPVFPDIYNPDLFKALEIEWSYSYAGGANSYLSVQAVAGEKFVDTISPSYFNTHCSLEMGFGKMLLAHCGFHHLYQVSASPNPVVSTSVNSLMNKTLDDLRSLGLYRLRYRAALTAAEARFAEKGTKKFVRPDFPAQHLEEWATTKYELMTSSHIAVCEEDARRLRERLPARVLFAADGYDQSADVVNPLMSDAIVACPSIFRLPVSKQNLILADHVKWARDKHDLDFSPFSLSHLTINDPTSYLPTIYQGPIVEDFASNVERQPHRDKLDPRILLKPDNKLVTAWLAHPEEVQKPVTYALDMNLVKAVVGARLSNPNRKDDLSLSALELLDDSVQILSNYLRSKIPDDVRQELYQLAVELDTSITVNDADFPSGRLGSLPASRTDLISRVTGGWVRLLSTRGSSTSANGPICSSRMSSLSEENYHTSSIPALQNTQSVTDLYTGLLRVLSLHTQSPVFNQIAQLNLPSALHEYHRNLVTIFIRLMPQSGIHPSLSRCCLPSMKLFSELLENVFRGYNLPMMSMLMTNWGEVSLSDLAALQGNKTHLSAMQLLTCLFTLQLLGPLGYRLIILRSLLKEMTWHPVKHKV